MTVEHHMDHRVSFGDCDPAGIAFYPNMFAWFDRTFHDWLRPHGGQAALCARLGSIGFGLMEAGAKFRTPLRPDDLLTLTLRVEEWGNKTLRLHYAGHVGDRLALTGHEVRGLFQPTQGGIKAAAIAPLRDILCQHGG